MANPMWDGVGCVAQFYVLRYIAGSATLLTQLPYMGATTSTVNSTKNWTFGTSGASQGLAVTYEERVTGGATLMHTDYTWTADGSGNLYVSEVKRTDQPGASQVQSKSTQVLDSYGNVAEKPGKTGDGRDVSPIVSRGRMRRTRSPPSPHADRDHLPNARS